MVFAVVVVGTVASTGVNGCGRAEAKKESMSWLAAAVLVLLLAVACAVMLFTAGGLRYRGWYEDGVKAGARRMKAVSRVADSQKVHEELLLVDG